MKLLSACAAAGVMVGMGRPALPASAAVVQYVGVTDGAGANAAKGTNVVGYDLYATKPLDTSFNSSSNEPFAFTRFTALPAYITDIAQPIGEPAGSSFFGGDKLILNSPLGGQVISGMFNYETNLASTQPNLLQLTIGPGAPSDFYISILTDTVAPATTGTFQGPLFTPSTLGVRMSTGSLSSSGLIQTTAPKTGNGDLYFYRISNAVAGDKAIIYGNQSTQAAFTGGVQSFHTPIAGVILQNNTPASLSDQAPVSAGVNVSADLLGAHPTDPIRGGAGRGGQARIQFPAVTSAGTFTANFRHVVHPNDPIAPGDPIAPNDPIFPSPVVGGYQIWNFAFDGQVPGDPIDVFLSFDPADFLPGTNLANLGIYHYTAGQWQVPTDPIIPGDPIKLFDIDTVNDTLHFKTRSFSPFAIGMVPEPGGMMFLAALAWSLRRKRRV